MSKIRTESDFQDVIDRDLSWRIHEISYLKRTLDKTAVVRKSAVVRAILPLLYAHWEGFVKKATSAYVEYVSGLNLCYSDLNDSFVAIGLGSEFSSYGVKSKSVYGHLHSVSFVRNKLPDKAVLPKGNIINTRSNLNSSVLDEIFCTVGIDITDYKTKFNFIDERLLKKRNAIAHGEFLDIDEVDIVSISSEVVTLLRMVKNDMQNAVSLKSYLGNGE